MRRYSHTPTTHTCAFVGSLFYLLVLPAAIYCVALLTYDGKVPHIIVDWLCVLLPFPMPADLSTIVPDCLTTSPPLILVAPYKTPSFARVRLLFTISYSHHRLLCSWLLVWTAPIPNTPAVAACCHYHHRTGICVLTTTTAPSFFGLYASGSVLLTGPAPLCLWTDWLFNPGPDITHQPAVVYTPHFPVPSFPCNLCLNHTFPFPLCIGYITLPCTLRCCPRFITCCSLFFQFTFCGRDG